MQVKKQKIGIDIRDLKIAKTGAHTYLSELCKAINNKQDLQFQYIFLDTHVPIYTGSHKIGKLWEQFHYVFWKQVTLPIKAWLHGCKLVFCTDYFVPYMGLGFTTVPVFHDAFFWEYPAHYNKYWLWFFNTLGVSAAKKSSSIVTVTNYAKHQIATYSGIDAAKIIPIHIGPKSSITDPQQNIDPHSSSNNWQQLLQKKYILHVGTIEKRKNLTTLITAFEQHITTSQQEIYLIIVGQKSNKPTLQDNAVFEMVAASSLLKERVIFTGFLPDSQTAALYKHAALYVFPSVNEGFGIPIIEALHSETPVIAAKGSCLAEAGGPNSLYFEPSNAEELTGLIADLLADEYKRKSMAASGKKYVEKFNGDKIATELMGLYQSILSR